VKAGLVRDCLARVISEFDVTDIAIEEEPIENYIIKIYNGGGGAGDE
jgi:ABC-type uncharacterized transport system ATPase subunit